MRTKNILPNELTIRRRIAERLRELRLLRSLERALARYRKENERFCTTARGQRDNTEGTDHESNAF
jgi:hypothetical protein